MANSPSPTADISVNEHEGAVFSLIARTQAVTRYQLFKAGLRTVARTTSYRHKQGSLYPLKSDDVEPGCLVQGQRKPAGMGTLLANALGRTRR